MTDTTPPEAARKSDAPYKKIVVIVNPAAGQDKPILGVFNRAFHDAGVDWDMQITKQAGDARRFAEDAVKAGVDAVAVYGGDGTVMEVANGLQSSGVPLAILPGGTANVMSVELGVPGDLAEATALVCGGDSFLRKVDLGRVRDRYFMLRIGIGFEADMINNADREAKDRMGKLAYILSALQTDKRTSCFQMVLDDGEEIEVEGLSCMIANSGNIGLPGVNLAQKIDVSDGLLDVLVIHNANLPGLVELAASAAGVGDPLTHYQVRSVRIAAEPRRAAICDGEPIGDTPLAASVAPHALSVIVPRQAVPGAAETAGAETTAS